MHWSKFITDEFDKIPVTSPSIEITTTRSKLECLKECLSRAYTCHYISFSKILKRCLIYDVPPIASVEANGYISMRKETF